jgi:AcrR family transcriptional regulator
MPELDDLPASERILEAAEQCFMTYGINKTTMEDVARHGGLSRATVYRYFKDRDSLIIASIRRRAHKPTKRFRHRLEEGDSFATRLEERIVYDIRRGNSDSVVQLLISSEHAGLASSVLGQSEVAAELTFELWEPLLTDAQSTGELKAGIDLREVASWIAHLEIMFLTQFPNNDSSEPQIRSFLRQFVIPALVAPQSGGST